MQISTAGYIRSKKAFFSKTQHAKTHVKIEATIKNKNPKGICTLKTTGK